MRGSALSAGMIAYDAGSLGYDHPSFAAVARAIDEQNHFLAKPFEIAEGVLKCKCGSIRVFSYTKQTRSADEATTVFAQCAECKRKWTES